jgi:selenocysteine lyase/cysteine desulfurase
VEAVRERQQRLVRRLADALREIPGVRLHGWRDGAPHTGILSFTVAGLDGGELAARLDRAHGICVRAGLHCAPAAHRRLGTFPDGTVRAGIGPFNSDHDVDALLKAVADLNAAGGR